VIFEVYELLNSEGPFSAVQRKVKAVGKQYQLLFDAARVSDSSL